MLLLRSHVQTPLLEQLAGDEGRSRKGVNVTELQGHRSVAGRPSCDMSSSCRERKKASCDGAMSPRTLTPSRLWSN